MDAFPDTNAQVFSTPNFPISFSNESWLRIVNEPSNGDRNLLGFQWLSQLSADLETANESIVKQQQQKLEQQLYSFLSPSSSPVYPTKAIRHLIANSFLSLFTRGESRRAYDLLVTLQTNLKGVIKPSKEEKDTFPALTVILHVVLIGKLSEKFGSQYLSIFSETVYLLLKFLKVSNDAHLRSSCIEAFTRSIHGCSRGLDETQIKDIIKMLRYSLMDKNMSVRRGASECLSILAKENSVGLQSFSDFEFYLSHLIKSLEGADYEARIAIAKSIASILACSQSNMLIIPVQPLRVTTKKKKMDETDESSPQKSTEKTLLTCSEMLSLVSTAFLKSNLSRECRTGLSEAYAILIQILGADHIANHYSDFLDHFVVHILSSTKLSSFPMPEIICIKSYVISLLRRVGEQLTEAHQLLAVKLIIEKYIVEWATNRNPSGEILNELTLHVLIFELSKLISSLAGVSSSLQEIYLDPFLKIAAHPSYLVQVSVSLCIMNIVLYSPSLFVSFFSSIFNILSKEVPYILPNASLDLCRRYVGYSLIIAALLHIGQHIPLYVPASTYLQVFSLASTLSKTNQKEVKDIGDIKKTLCIREVAWNLIIGLMTSGSSPVKLYLNQCLVLWKDALPKTLPSNVAERHVLLHEKEACLRSIVAFLIHNSELANNDVKKRLSTLISNGIRLMLSYSSFTTSTSTASITLNFPIAWGPLDLEYLFKKRLFECICLLPISSFEEFHPQLMNRATEIFAQDFCDAKRLDAGILAQVFHGVEKNNHPVNSSFGVIFWHGTEYGITTLPCCFQASDSLWKHGYYRNPDTKTLVDYEQWLPMESLLFHPIQGALEYDMLSIFQFASNAHARDMLLPSPPFFSLVNAAMLLAAYLLPAFVTSIQEAYLETVVRVARQKPEKMTRKIVYLVNLIYMLHMAMCNMSCISKSFELSKKAAKIIFELTELGMAIPDAGFRYICGYLVGKTAEFSDIAMVSHITQSLVNQIVEKTDSPEMRSGGALSLSMLHVFTRSSSSIKSTVNLLQGLCNDIHPTVSQWAIIALGLLFEQRSADVLGYVDIALQCSFKQLLKETRPLHVGDLLYACVAALGPEIQVCDDRREKICQMAVFLITSRDYEECAEAWFAVSHILLMAPNAFPVSKFASLLQMLLSSPHTSLRQAALTCLCQMVQRYPEQVLMSTENLEQTLLGLVQDFPVLVKKCIASLVAATRSPSRWVDLCRQFLTPSVPGQGNQALISTANTDTEDDTEGLAVSASHLPKAEKKQAQAKWYSQLAALQALRQVINHLAKLDPVAHFHFQISNGKQIKRDLLVFRVGDLIRVAFTASTSLIQKVRAEGLCLLEDVLDFFSSTKDPDYEGHMLLEQYQAQFSSALTPAFHPDAHPELLAKACRVCARYIGSGITEELFTLSRIIKLLTQALEVSQAPLPSLSEHAQIMVSVAVYGAWADLQNVCQTNPPLAEIVKPQLPKLIPLWLTCLIEYAIIKLEPDEYNMSPSQLTNISTNLIYATGNRQVVIEIYKSVWISILSAVTSLFSLDSIDVHLQKLGSVVGEQGEVTRITLILFGLAFEPLVSIGTSSHSINICLDALMAIVTPKFIPLLYTPFAMEIVHMSERLLQTEPLFIQLKVIEFLDKIITTYQPNISSPITDELIRILIAIIARTLPEILVDPSAAEIFINKTKDGVTLAVKSLKIIAHISFFHRNWIPLTLHLYSIAFQSELLAPCMAPLTMLLKSIFESEVDITLSCSFVATLLNIVQKNMKSSPDLAKPSLIASTLVFSLIGSMSLTQSISSVFMECAYIPQLSLPVFQCIRSIVSRRAEPNEFLNNFIYTVLPQLLIFVLTDDKLLTQECINTLGAIGCMQEYTEIVLSGLVGILVKYPTFLQLKPVIALHLLNIGKQHVNLFRDFVQKLSPPCKQSFESCLRTQTPSQSTSPFLAPLPIT